MCNLCEKKKEIEFYPGFTLSIIENTMFIDRDDYDSEPFSLGVKIGYCPSCGRKLNEQRKD